MVNNVVLNQELSEDIVLLESHKGKHCFLVLIFTQFSLYFIYWEMLEKQVSIIVVGD